MDTEKLAVDAVTHSLAITYHAKGFINVGDKMPSWDGNIILYSSKNYSKENICKLPVQVKGINNSDFSKSTISYPIEIKDLTNYYNDGGVLFFVVYIDNSRSLNKIYYKDLLPVFINQLLATHKSNSKTISVKFSDFPNTEVEKMNICYDFISNRKKQFSFVEDGFPTIEEFKNKKDVEFSFSLTDYDGSISKCPEKIINKDIYLYAMEKNKKYKVPVSSTIMIRKIVTQLNLPISVNRKKFFNSYLVIRTENGVRIQIGKILTIDKNTLNDNISKLNIHIKGTLKERINGIKFLIEAHNHKCFHIGELCFEFNLKTDEEKFKTLELDDKLEWLERTQKMLDLLNVHVDLDMDKATERDLDKLEILTKCIVDDAFLPNKPKDIFLQNRIKICNLNLTLICFENKNNASEYTFKNFYDKRFCVYNFDKNDESRKAPVICTLKKVNFLQDNNIDYDFIVRTITEFPQNPMLFEFTNMVMLEMLSAYDENKDDKLYSSITKISEFILNNSGNDNEITKLNYYQIKKRKHCLTIDELKDIDNINSTTKNDFVKIGCSILLESYGLAEALINQLPEDQKQKITNYPIYNLLLKKEKYDGKTEDEN